MKLVSIHTALKMSWKENPEKLTQLVMGVKQHLLLMLESGTTYPVAHLMLVLQSGTSRLLNSVIPLNFSSEISKSWLCPCKTTYKSCTKFLIFLIVAFLYVYIICVFLSMCICLYVYVFSSYFICLSIFLLKLTFTTCVFKATFGIFL